MFSFKKLSLALAAGVLLATGARAQSSDQNYPSPATESEITGSIKARDIGDARLTTHFWAFEGAQGDIFINVVTRNFVGDIDVYVADRLRPLTKIVIFGDGITETGRVVYIRQPGRLLLRVQGRTPNDDAAEYRVKFAGSFVALAPEKTVRPPEVTTSSDTGIQVNSVGTIVGVSPKPKASPVERVEDRRSSETESAQAKEDRARGRGTGSRSADTDRQSGDPGVETVFGNRSAKVTVKKATPQRAVVDRTSASEKTGAKKPGKAIVPDPMEGIYLIVTFKDGHVLERPMTEIARFIYAGGFLTVSGKDGNIARYAMTDVASVTVR